MPWFGRKDFYIAIALYALLKSNRDAKPSLVQPCKDAAQFTITTNTSKDFNVYVKFATDRTTEKAWRINLTDKNKADIDTLKAKNRNTYLFLILGQDKKPSCTIAVLTMDEYNQIARKSGITIKLESDRNNKFDVMDGKNRVLYRIDRNRIEKPLGEMVEYPETDTDQDIDIKCELESRMESEDKREEIPENRHQFYYTTAAKKKKADRIRRKRERKGLMCGEGLLEWIDRK